MQEDILAELKSLLKDDNFVISFETPLVTSGLLSSLVIVEMAAWIEKKYGVQFKEYGFNIYDFETIHSICDLIVNMKNDR